MPLLWDPLLVRHLARELDGALRGARLRALRLDGSTREAALLFREATLHWSLHPAQGAPRVLPPAEPASGDLPLTGRVHRVGSPADERIVVLEILPIRRGRSALDIRVELLGNQWNLVVTEGADARIRHVLVRRRDRRDLVVGSAYAPPASSGREGCLEPLSLERWQEILTGASAPVRRRELVRTVAWTSSVNADALTPPGDPPDVEALRAGYLLWRGMAHEDAPARPVLLQTRSGPQPYPWPLPGIPADRHATLLEALDAWTSALQGGAEALLAPELVAALEAGVDHASRRVSRLRAELAGAPDPAALRASGDLLLARLSSVPQGSSEVVLEDFEGRPVRVELDPRLAPHENADALYERAARAERARERLPGLLVEAEARTARLEELLDRVRRGEAEEKEVRRALPRPAQDRAAPKGSSGSPLPYRSYRSSGGMEIRVGRGARHNDELTFRHSAPQDVWLHARHASGAHVILRWGRTESPPARDLHEAAVLAALNSRARTSGTVPVDWTLRKYVRKPRGSPPGRVVMERARTVFVTPDPELAERLAEGEAE
jgi:hypothetical protein